VLARVLVSSSWSVATFFRGEVMGAPLSQRAPAALWMCAGREWGLLAAKPVMRMSTRYMPFPSGVIVELPLRPGSRFSVTLIGTEIMPWACAAVAAVMPSTTAASSAAPLFQPIRTRMDQPPTSLGGSVRKGIAGQQYAGPSLPDFPQVKYTRRLCCDKHGVADFCLNRQARQGPTRFAKGRRVVILSAAKNLVPGARCPCGQRPD